MLVRSDLARQEALAEWAPRHKANPKKPSSSQTGRAPAPGREPTESTRSEPPPVAARYGLDESSARRLPIDRNASHLASHGQAFHCAGDILDRYIRVHAALIERVDPIGPETLEHHLDDLSICSGRPLRLACHVAETEHRNFQILSKIALFHQVFPLFNFEASGNPYRPTRFSNFG